MKTWRSLRALLTGGAVTLVAAGCGTSHPPASSPTSTAVPVVARVTGIATVHLAQVGATVLVDNHHEPLYMFLPDDKTRVTCTGLCAASWPPVYWRGHAPTIAGAVRAALIGHDPDPTGGQVVTYSGWPLYTYEDDTQPGYAAGQGVDLDGGYWYLLLPDGRPLVPHGLPAPSAAGS